MVTPPGLAPEDMDKIGCQVYTLLVITEGYKKRMLDWQDSIRSHYGMAVIKRDMDPEYLLKEERKTNLELIEKMGWENDESKKKALRILELRNHSEYEDMTRFVARKRAQYGTSPLPH